MWGCFDVAIGIATIAIAKETRGLSLEKSAQPELFSEESEAKLADGPQNRTSASTTGSDNKTSSQVQERRV